MAKFILKFLTFRVSKKVIFIFINIQELKICELCDFFGRGGRLFPITTIKAWLPIVNFVVAVGIFKSLNMQKSGMSLGSA